MDDGLGVEVAGDREEEALSLKSSQTPSVMSVRLWFLLHALGRLPGDVDQLDHLELGLQDVEVVVQTGALAPLGDYGQLGFGGVAHEQQDVHVTRFPGETGIDKTEIQKSSENNLGKTNSSSKSTGLLLDVVHVGCTVPGYQSSIKLRVPPAVLELFDCDVDC